MRPALTLHLALCAALTLRAPTHCQNQENLPDNETHLQCDGHPPTIGVTYHYNDTSDYQYLNRVYNSPINVKYVSVPFGTSVDVRCFVSSIVVAKRLTMTRDGQILPTKKHRGTIVWSTRKLDPLKSEYEYVCTDVETNCKRSIITLVTPGLEVISENIHISVDDDHTNYIVQYDKSMTVLCSGPDAARLVISLHGEPLVTERESVTAIKRFETKPLDLQTSEFICTDVFTTYNRSVTVRVVPTVYFQSGNKSITPNYMYFDKWRYDSFVYYIDYSDSIEVYCSGSRAVKLIEHGDENISFSTEKCNSTMVKYMKKLKLGQSRFHCTGCEVADYVNKVRVIVTPRIEVRSPNVLRVENWQRVTQYILKYGTDLEIICSETDSAQLRIRYKFSEDCAKQVVNETAIKCVVKELKSEDTFIDCYRLSDSFEDEPARVRVGVLPADVVDFHCVSHRVQYFNCSWTAPNLLTFTLSYIENGILAHVCEKGQSPRKSKYCIWDYGYDSKLVETEVFTFILKSCNMFGCSNQTFHIEHVSVLKPTPPQKVRILNTTARGAVLAWSADLGLRVAGEYLYLDTGSLQYKMQYWYSGIEPRDVNSSLVTCQFPLCRIELILPCPGYFYQVWIYRKPKRAVGEEFWSDPSSVSFHTTVVENGKIDDPACSWKPRKTPEVMTYLVQERKQDVHIDMQPLKEKVNSLTAKLAAIRTYLEQQGKGTR